MDILTLVQFVEVTAAYCIMTLLVPAILFYPKIKHLNFSVRFMMYQMAGNFYMMNLVLVLELLRISNRVTLFLFTLIPCIVIYWAINNKNPKKIAKDLFELVEKVAVGEFGVRLLLFRIRKFLGRMIKKLFRSMWRRLYRNLPDLLLYLAFLAVIIYTYGLNLFKNYGYCTSDIPVHNYWINYLVKNKVFVAGVYPFGFHCVVYYLRTIFGIPTYVLLRIFCFVQNVFVHSVLLAFIRSCCKSKYAAYFGMGMYMVFQLFEENTYIRYYSSLPQEFGMIFILPGIYFLFAFFEKRKQNDLAELALQKKTAGETAAAQGEEQDAGAESGGTEQMEGNEADERQESAEGREDAGSRESGEIREDTGLRESMEIHGDAGFGESGEIHGDADDWEDGQVKRKKKKKEKVKKIKKPKKPKKQRDVPEDAGLAAERKWETWYLVFFAMGFSMTLTVHFYGTMVAGIFCMGVAVGYFFRLFRKKYFGRVMLAGIISVTIAVAPMVIAFITGTPLQGSLGWGMNVIKGTNNQGSAASSQTESSEAEDGEESDELGEFGDGEPGEENGEGISDAEGDGQGSGGAAGTAVQVKRPLKERIVRRIKRTTIIIEDAYRNYLFEDGVDRMYLLAVPGGMALLFVLSLFYFLMRQTDYAARLLSTAAYIGMMSVLVAASRLGLPPLMDALRTSVYLAYSLAVLWSLCLDAVLSVFLGWFKRRWFLNTVSLAASAALIYGVSQDLPVRSEASYPAMQMNEAVICLTNIIRDNTDFKWTIVSANDEYRMGEDYGWHYEINTFLKEMEYVAQYGNILIPTEKVYFFIEKIPVDYGNGYAHSGQSISEEGAKRPLPSVGGIHIYQAENRWVEMSRMYYWAQKFMELYPNEMKVYYESDRFVCYCVEQDTYSLYNFSIDYGYNVYTPPSADEEEG